ncbi:Gfo/Idh/MocA family protein [Spirosoma sp. KNUC1025]|uniref:Gfo/Idh/MocA family protein n=1 Tax=Spirosoma sp. KNUC1025 TaxID=2894082 RepID=UPI001E5EF3FB|nr:Gfo/Idh/MocA family oxidoreductase [Spirosoma sp. KNUC1025]UFH57875.1 Gfo/Idh/MocA family oxidoreductase [Spirosoma sp. KNUC1025]
MKKQKLRVGLAGLQAGRSWAAVAHLPALHELSDHYEIVGVVNSSLESSQAAAEACAIPRAFGSIDEMAASEDIDLVVVTVRVPLHYEAVKSILSHGKHVYCEWPLGRTLAEAEELTAMARERSVVAVAGTQARVSPAIRTLSELIKTNSIGSIVSSSIHGWATPGGYDQRYKKRGIFTKASQWC